MKRPRRTARLGAVAGAAATMLVLASAPAWAADQSQTLQMGSIVFAHGGVYNSGYTFWACDDRANGQTAVTEVILNNGYTDNVSDPNGSASGCGRKNTPGQFYAVQFRVCSGALCTGWARAF